MPALSPVSRTRCIAILGRRDQPTDAVEEYCQYLGEALKGEEFELEIVRVRWDEIGSAASMQELRGRIRETQNPSRNDWFLLQYTALAWSRRGFPLRIVRLVKFLKKQGARCAVVFHDAEAYGGKRWVDRLRRIVQRHVMRRLLLLSDISFFTVPREKVSWVPAGAKNIVFIPVGANLPSPEKAWSQTRNPVESKPCIAVFSITGNPRAQHEINLISEAVSYAAKQIGPLRIVVFGRNSEAGEELRVRLAGSPVEVNVLGLIPAEEIVRVLGASDVLLFVRGQISSRRGSAIAGIACGLPVIAQEGSETAPPITDAGVVLVPATAPRDFGPALLRVLTDQAYRESLAERSRNAQTRYFSWTVIAAQYAKALRDSASQLRQTVSKQKQPGSSAG
ncbi:MAG: glycosyltransferase family 4 protein [Candidatus Acidiferrum sp.]